MAFSFKQSNIFTQNGFSVDYKQNTPMLIQDGYHSPNRSPVKDSSKLTPKSILKDSLGSGSKAKKNIIINETLNETRKYSHRNDNVFEDRNPIVTLFPEPDNSIRKERPKTALTSFGPVYRNYDDQSGIISSANKIQENDRSNQDSKFPICLEDRTRRSVPTEGYCSSMNVSNISKNELTDFQKAYIKRLQREREQTKYYELLKKQNETSSKESDENNKLSSLEEKDQNKSEKGNVEEMRNSSFNTPLVRKKDENHKYTDTKHNLPGSPGLNQIETKISLLQQTLDMYSQKLQVSIAKLKGQWIKEEEVLNKELRLNNALTKEVNNKKNNILPSEAELRDNRQKENKKYHTKREDYTNGEEIVNTRNSESGLRRDNMKLTEEKINDASKTKKRNTNNKVEELKAELERFKRENQFLKSKMRGSEENNNNKMVSKQNYKKNITTEDVFEKEQALLKTIDQIRGKLKRSLSNKSAKEINDENALKSPSENMTRTYIPYKESTKSRCLQKELQNKVEDVKTINAHQVRRAYGAERLKVENSYILNQGLSSSYNGFNWNTDQSLKISKNI